MIPKNGQSYFRRVVGNGVKEYGHPAGNHVWVLQGVQRSGGGGAGARILIELNSDFNALREFPGKPERAFAKACKFATKIPDPVTLGQLAQLGFQIDAEMLAIQKPGASETRQQAAACFTHEASRYGDPHLHEHGLLGNVTL